MSKCDVSIVVRDRLDFFGFLAAITGHLSGYKGYEIIFQKKAVNKKIYGISLKHFKKIAMSTSKDNIPPLKGESPKVLDATGATGSMVAEMATDAEKVKKSDKATREEEVLSGNDMTNVIDENEAVDYLVECGHNPEWFDTKIQSLAKASLVQQNGAPSGDHYAKKDGYYIMRVFGSTVNLFYHLEHQGYGKVMKKLSSLIEPKEPKPTK